VSLISFDIGKDKKLYPILQTLCTLFSHKNKEGDCVSQRSPLYFIKTLIYYRIDSVLTCPFTLETDSGIKSNKQTRLLNFILINAFPYTLPLSPYTTMKRGGKQI
jgi:hypothetical protein